jgi:XTP/dITP diphosphohydrolase
VRLLFASHNPHKLNEIQELLSSELELVTPASLGISTEFDPEETGDTFEANARIKAVAFAEKTGEICVADDSGLVVAALGGWPGVKSKRVHPGSDEDRCELILSRLNGMPNRKASFVTVLCVYNPKTKKEQYVTGRVDGRIADEPRGEAGFGYDPIFIPDGYDNTFAELGQNVKNKLSHRARAIEALNTLLQN